MKSLKAEKMEIELALLKSQINPHFFFNTLNNLYGLAVEKSDKAPEMILKLSDMMRYTIYEGKEKSVFLKDEISYLENFIELHKIRFQKKVDIKFDKQVDDTIEIAPLLLIILLENAFKHGVESMTEDAYIHINLKTDAKKLFFSVENNFDPQKESGTKGIGLENLKQRLELIYPKQYSYFESIVENVYRAHVEIEVK